MSYIYTFDFCEDDVSTLYAGEKITCENGHYICTVIKTIKPGTHNWSKNLGNWQMPEPAPMSQPVCYVCGGLFWNNRKGGLMHIQGRGWVMSSDVSNV